MIDAMHKLMCEVTYADSPEGWAKNLYKYTECGASLSVEDAAVAVSSIVEGVDQGTEVHRLVWPFTAAEYHAAVDAVETEARQLWNDTHGCPDCYGGIYARHAEDLYSDVTDNPVDPDCEGCSGYGVVI